MCPKLLQLGRDQLKQALSGTPAYSLIDPGAHEQGAGMIATVANATRPFAERRGFAKSRLERACDWPNDSLSDKCGLEDMT